MLEVFLGFDFRGFSVEGGFWGSWGGGGADLGIFAGVRIYVFGAVCLECISAGLLDLYCFLSYPKYIESWF